MIEKQIEQLSIEERRALEAASMVGMEFAAATVAAALATEVLLVVEQCERLVRRGQFLQV
jgi:hypothetical protein